MILPLHDENPLRVIPFQFVTALLIAICSLVFFAELFLPDGFNMVVAQLGTVPAEIVSTKSCWPQNCAVPHSLTLLTNMFAHGGWMHFLGNMLFLWVFGDNIEDSMGHLRFLCFYLFCGLCASMTHVLFNMDSLSPMIGASGAIAGVMGAYLILHPRVKILVLVFMRLPLRLPARIVLLIWIGLQCLMVANDSSGHVAVWAHIGGFIAGVLLIPLFKRNNVALFDRGTRH